MSLRTRFAPSPTGDLHIGGARTALFCYLLAKQAQGTFILRIEDTDLARSSQAAVEGILEAMAWLKLNYDEGPFFQTHRFDRYRDMIQVMLERGLAYRCSCSKERLDALRTAQMEDKRKPRYDGHCRPQNLGPEHPHVIRFKNPESGTVAWDDLVKGRIEFANQELDDLIIARSDGVPTYNFTVVVDDYDMKITHVIRGDDHVNNTPRQINMLQALGAPLPAYAHVPMVLVSDGQKLSKRHGAASVMEFRKAGYLPEALINYLARLSWSHGDQEIFSRAELIEKFSLNKVNHSPAAFDYAKLNWVNQHYLKTAPLPELLPELTWHYQQQGIDLTQGPRLADLRPLLAERVQTLAAWVTESRYFFEEPTSYEPNARLKHFTAEAVAPLSQLLSNFQTLKQWEASHIHSLMTETAATLNLPMGKIGMPLRLALTGLGSSPAIDKTAELIGQAKTLSRLRAALHFIQNYLTQ